MCIMHGGGQGNKPILLQSHKWHVLLHKSCLLTKMILLFYVYMYVPHWPMIIACKYKYAHGDYNNGLLFYHVLHEISLVCKGSHLQYVNQKKIKFQKFKFHEYGNLLWPPKCKGINVLHNLPFREGFAFYHM